MVTFNKGGECMNYLCLIKLIAGSSVPANEETDKIKEIAEDAAVDIPDELYQKEIGKYLSGQSKDLYC